MAASYPLYLNVLLRIFQHSHPACAFAGTTPSGVNLADISHYCQELLCNPEMEGAVDNSRLAG
jgi:hypothetical protein